jgi:hypothetical protein
MALENTSIAEALLDVSSEGFIEFLTGDHGPLAFFQPLVEELPVDESLGYHAALEGKLLALERASLCAVYRLYLAHVSVDDRSRKRVAIHPNDDFGLLFFGCLGRNLERGSGFWLAR